MLGYDQHKHVFELLRKYVDDMDSEEIRYADFLEDSQPQYLLVLIANRSTRKTRMQIIQIKKEDLVREESQQIYQTLE